MFDEANSKMLSIISERFSPLYLVSSKSITSIFIFSPNLSLRYSLIASIFKG